MNKKSNLIVAVLLSAVLLVLLVTGVGIVSAQEEGPASEMQASSTEMQATQSVYGVIQSEPALASFETLVEAAALHDNLQQDGPFTVFAPTNEAWAAFEAMAAGTNANMTDILLYHVLNGEYPAATIQSRRALPTLAGRYLFFEGTGASSVDADLRAAIGADAGVNAAATADTVITVNEMANVVRTDIQATNGIVHIIDAVIATPEGNSLFASTQGSPDASIAEVLAADGRFNTFLSLAQQAGLRGHLEDVGATYTVFAPTDEAFAAVPDGMMEEWLSDPQGALRTILSYHIVGDHLNINQIATDDYLPTLEGRALAVTTDEEIAVYLNGRAVRSFNILAANGLVHVMDEVIMP